MSQSSTSFCFEINSLSQLQAKPAPFSSGEVHFWTDPHIAKQMLAAHLNPNTYAASRCPETVRRTVAWIVNTLGLSSGQSVLFMPKSVG